MSNNYGQIQSAVQEMLDKRDEETDPDQEYDDFYEHEVIWGGGKAVILEKAIKNSGLIDEPLALLDHLALLVFKGHGEGGTP